MANSFVHVELMSGDLPKAKEFYAKLFDWTLEDVSMEGGRTYTMIHVGDGVGGGMTSNPAPGMPSHWMAYVLVDDCAAATAKARQLGAQIVVDTMTVGDYGTMSVFVDPTGAALALWQANPR